MDASYKVQIVAVPQTLYYTETKVLKTMSLSAFQTWLNQKLADYVRVAKLKSTSMSEMCQQEYVKYSSYTNPMAFLKELYEHYQYDGAPRASAAGAETTLGEYLYDEDYATKYIKLTPHPRNHEHKYTLIWLHGLGDSAHGYSEIFASSQHKLVPLNCKIVLPTAPVQAVTFNNGQKMTSWYNIKERFDPNKEETLTLD